MTPAEVAKVLTKCAAYDQRTIGQGDVLAWHEILDAVELADALDAVRRHYRAESRRAMPADILTHSRAAKTERQNRERRAAPPGTLAIESKFSPLAGEKAAPAYERSAAARAVAREQITKAQAKFAAARREFATAEDALNALDDALADQAETEGQLAEELCDPRQHTEHG